jgi:hypothetical protein
LGSSGWCQLRVLRLLLPGSFLCRVCSWRFLGFFSLD